MALPPTVGLILHFRDWRRTVSCLESLRDNQLHRVLVVDNSEDQGWSLWKMRESLERLDRSGVETVIIDPVKNLGFSAGVNRGLEEIQTRFGRVCVLVINNDARLRRGGLAALREALSGGCSVAIPRMLSVSGEVTDSVHYHRPTGLLLRISIPGSYEYLSGCCMLLRADLAVPPLFDEAFFFYGDDAELGWRFQRQAVVQKKVPEAVVEHDGSAGSRNGSLFYEYHMARAHWILARRLSTGFRTLAFHIVGRTVVLPLRALYRSIRHGSSIPLRGLALATWDVMHGRCRSLTPPAPPESVAGDAETRR